MKTPMRIALVGMAAFSLAGMSGAWAQNKVQIHSSGSSTSTSVSTVNGQTVVTLNGKQVYAGPSQGAVTTRSTSSNGVEYAAVFDGDQVLWENSPGAAQQLRSMPAAPTPPGVGLHPLAPGRHQPLLQPHVSTNLHRLPHVVVGPNGTVQPFKPAGAVPPSAVPHAGAAVGDQMPARPVSQGADTAFGVKMVNNSTVIMYQGKEISVGPARGTISTKSKTVNGKNYAAAFDDDRVIWENVPGAAGQLK